MLIMCFHLASWFAAGLTCVHTSVCVRVCGCVCVGVCGCVGVGVGVSSTKPICQHQHLDIPVINISTV